MPGRILILRACDRLYNEIPCNTAMAIIFVWLASFFDYYLTVYEVNSGAVELNPLLAPFFNSHLFVKALVLKVFLTFPGICILSVFYRRQTVRRALPVVVIVYLCILVYHAVNLYC